MRKAGFEPIGMCVGSCVYHVGIQYRSWSKNQELDVLSRAMYHARELAMERMRAEAQAMGADGIVGVKLTIKRMEWDNHMLEFIAIGTGVVHRHGPQGLPRARRRPVHLGPVGPGLLVAAPRRLSAGRDGDGFVRLSRRASRHAGHARGTVNSNVELENFTAAMYEAREIAIERMQAEAATAKAEGVVGLDIHEGSHGWETHVIEFFAIGTAVSPLDAGNRAGEDRRSDHGAVG